MQHQQYYQGPMNPNKMQPIPPPKQNKGLNNYKTKKCRHFEMGKCKLGGLCNFAHGNRDLRDTRPNEILTPQLPQKIEKIPNLDINNSYEKILLLENKMETVFASQKKLIGQLKQHTLNIQTMGVNSPEQHVR